MQRESSVGTLPTPYIPGDFRLTALTYYPAQSAIIGKSKPAVPAAATAKNSASNVTGGQTVSNGPVGGSVGASKAHDNALPLDDEDAQLASLNQGKGAAELDG